MTRFVEWWNSLSQGLRDGIIAGIISTVAATILLGILKLSGISIRAGFRCIFNRRPQLPPLPPPPPDPQHAPLIPKSPSVGFVARRDKEKREIVELLKENLSPTSSQLVALWGEGGHGKTTL